MVPLAEILGVVGERYLGWCSQSAEHNWTNDEPANGGMWAKGMPEKKTEIYKIKTNKSVLKIKRQREGHVIKYYVQRTTCITCISSRKGSSHLHVIRIISQTKECRQRREHTTPSSSYHT